VNIRELRPDAEEIFVLTRSRRLSLWQQLLDVLLPGSADIADLAALGTSYLVRTGDQLELITIASGGSEVVEVTREVNASGSRRSFRHGDHSYRVSARVL
jgi:hypothetical protein